MPNFKKIALLFISSLLTLTSFNITLGDGFQPIADTLPESGTESFYMNDGTSLLCYVSVVEMGNPLPVVCSDLGWTVEDLHNVDPIKVFGHLYRLVPNSIGRAIGKGHYNVCISTPSVCKNP